MRRHFGHARFSPRPRASKTVRKLSWTGSMAYIENGGGRLETRDAHGEFAIEFHNSDRFRSATRTSMSFCRRRSASPRASPCRSEATTTPPRRLATTWASSVAPPRNLLFEHGSFYDGRKTTLGISRGRLNLTPQLSIEPSLSVNWVDLVEGAFTARLFGSRVTYTMTPKMFVSALLQYNSANDALAANVRLRWEYQPGSELFVVLNEQRDTLVSPIRVRALANRSLIVKINRLFRF